MSSDADRYLAELDDADEHVRSRAAAALHRLGHPKAVEACLRTLDDEADPLHADHSPSVRCLIEIGWPALGPVFEHLSAEGYLHRARAQRAAEGITKRRFGFDGTAWPPGALERWLAWAERIDYEADAPADRRAVGLARLRAWIAAGGHPE